MGNFNLVWALILMLLSSCGNSGAIEALEGNIDPSLPLGDGLIIFESDFSNDTGYSVESTTLWNGGSGNDVPLPTGWDGVIASGGSKLSVVEGAGKGGGNAMKFEWNPTASQPTISLGKHLTGDESTGYDELYIRYRVKLPNRFMVGTDGTDSQYWKWGRLWQNTSPDNSAPNKWTENRANSNYIIWTFSNAKPYITASATWAENTTVGSEIGSVNGPRYKVDYFSSGEWSSETSPGAFESLWDLNDESRPAELENNTSQTYHTLEYRFKLASSAEAEDGVFEMWWDGIPQGEPRRITASGGASKRAGLPTTVNGSGLNFFVLFDNIAGWNALWGNPDVDGFVYLDDVVISDDYIGPYYQVGL